jgi:hypothetical protein
MYFVMLLIGVICSATAVALVTDLVLFESSGFTFERELYLDHITEEVELTIPFAILLNSMFLYLQYSFLPRIRERRGLERAIGFANCTFLLSFLVWLNYAMFHVFADRYSQSSLALMLLAPTYLLVCFLFFFRRSRKELHQQL